MSSNVTTIRTYENTCDECICYGFLSNITSLYLGFNCYKNNHTCSFFTNYSSSTMMTINVNSTFIFVQQPPQSSRPNITTGN